MAAASSTGTPGRPRARRGPRAARLALAGVPGLAAVGLLVLLPTGTTLLPGPSGAARTAAVLALCAALVATQLGRVHLEVRGRTRSLSLVGSPLVVGLLFVPLPWVLLAQVVAALVSARVQRTPLAVAAVPTSVHLLGTALAGALLHTTLPPAPSLGVPAAVVTVLALAAAEVLGSALLLLSARAQVGPLDRDDLLRSLLPALVTVGVASGLGLLCVVLLEEGPLGWVLLGLVGTGSAWGFRGYLLLRRRHHDLRMLQRFVDGSVRADHGEVMAADLVTGVRELARAETARLVWRSREGEVQVHVSSHDPTLLVPPLVMPPPGTEGLLDAATAGPDVRAWLGRVAARQAVVVDLTRYGGAGLLVVSDRLGDGAGFGADDLRLVGALAGHLVVRLRNTELVDRIRWEADHDTMTGLPNRRVLLSALELYIGPRAAPRPPGAGVRAVGRQAGPAHERRAAPETAVLVMVVDRLGEVNDALGHAVGDQVLAEVARRLTRLGLPGATVARLSGEHFAVAVPAVRPGGVLALAQRLRSTTDEPVALADAVVSAGARVGVATTTGEDGVDAAELLRRADAALAAARGDGRQVAVYERSLDSGRTERLALLGDLHRALDEGVLTVHFQPKLDLVRGRVGGVEALVRWDHPVLGAVSPEVFVPLAESAGLVDRLTDHVLAVALDRARAWEDEGLDLVVAVNLSARSLDDEALPARVAAALAAAGVRADRLALEITETSLMGDPGRTLPVLHALAALGVGLSLDDFGTGYSSLSYLQRLPVTELKVDRSFVVALEDPDATGGVALVSSILGLAQGLGLSVVAEGVESARAMATLRGLGCGQVQGFLVSRAVSGAALPGVVRSIEADPAWATGRHPSSRGAEAVVEA